MRNVGEYIELPLSACINQKNIIQTVEKVDYRALLNSVKNGIYTFSGKHNIYDLSNVLGIIMSDAEQEKQGITNNFFGGNPNLEQTGRDKMSNQNVNINNSTIHGSVVAAEKIENSFNSLQESKADDVTKKLFEQLLSEIKTLNTKVPESQAAVVEKMATRADGLIAESKIETPDREWYEVSVKGLLEATKAIGSLADPVLKVVKKISALLIEQT